MIKFILCIDESGGLGYKGDLLYHISKDLRRFKELTKGHIIVSGRKTQESLPNEYLPKRTNVVVTRYRNYKPKNDSVIVYNDLQAMVNQYKSGDHDKDMIIIGGAKIYNDFPVYPQVIHLTLVLDYANKVDTRVNMNNLLGDEVYIEYKKETHYDEKLGVFYQFIDYVKFDYLKEYHSKILEESCL